MAVAPVVLVLQTNVRCGPAACRSLARAGFRVVAGHEDGRWGRTRHADVALTYPRLAEDPDGVLEAVESFCRRRGVACVLPLNEGVLHLLVERLPAPGGAVLSGPTHEQYEGLCDKAGLARTAAAAGVWSPPGVVVGAGGPDGGWPALPSVVKPVTSATPGAEGVVYRAAAVVRTAAEREEALRLALETCERALVQERVVGPGWRVHFVRGERGLATLAHRTLRTFPRRAGMASVSSVEAAPPEVVEATDRLAASVGYRGGGSAQFIERDGRHHVHDVNLRMPYSLAASIRAGLDLPRLVVEEALGRAPELAPRRIRQVRYVWFGGEGQAMVADLRGGPRRWPAAGGAAAEILLAAALPRRVLDPVDLSDPAALLGMLHERRDRRRAGRPAPVTPVPAPDAERVGTGRP
jgi:hypothetical protein